MIDTRVKSLQVLATTKIKESEVYGRQLSPPTPPKQTFSFPPKVAIACGGSGTTHWAVPSQKA
jgi:hypothetical protein